MNATHAVSACAIGVAAICMMTTFSPAGDLNPPSGIVMPTMKPLDQVEPRIPINRDNTPGDSNAVYVISQSGSYYLTENLAGITGKHGIRIDAEKVTLDLSGFTLVGHSATLDGVSTVINGLKGIRIINGFVSEWGEDGIDLHDGHNHHVTGIIAQDNGARGIVCDETAIVRSCAAYQNGLEGIQVGNGSLVDGCSVRSNGATGIATGSTSMVSNCAVQDNATGIFVISDSTVAGCLVAYNQSAGILAGDGGSISDCTVTWTSGGHGIDVVNNCYVHHNTCDDNSASGIHTSGVGNRIDSNVCTSNDIGIHIEGVSNLIVRNWGSLNATSNYEITFASSNNVGPFVVDSSTNSNPHANYE